MQRWTGKLITSCYRPAIQINSASCCTFRPCTRSYQVQFIILYEGGPCSRLPSFQLKSDQRSVEMQLTKSRYIVCQLAVTVLLRIFILVIETIWNNCKPFKLRLPVAGIKFCNWRVLLPWHSRAQSPHSLSHGKTAVVSQTSHNYGPSPYPPKNPA